MSIRTSVGRNAFRLSRYRRTAVPVIPYSNTRSVSFGGGDEYVEIGDVAALQFDRLSPFSMSAWFKTTAAGGAILAKREAVNYGRRRGYSVRFRRATVDQVSVLLTNSDNVNEIQVVCGFPLGTYSNGSWHHIVVTYDGSSIAAGVQVYLDGSSKTLVVEYDSLTDTILTTAPFNIGREGGGEYSSHVEFIGLLDECAMYNKALSPSEVTSMYNTGEPIDLREHPTNANLVGWWRMGDVDTFPILTDRSIAGNNGTMVNMEASDIVIDVP